MKQEGFSYLEALISMFIFSLIAVSVFPLMMNALTIHNKLQQKDQLIAISNYVGDYIHNWDDFDPSSKIVPFDFYSDGSELELSGDYQVNHLQFIDPLLSSSNESIISDYYKASIQFYETASVNRAVIKVKIWFDDNMDNIAQSTENSVNFTTILIEKLNSL